MDFEALFSPSLLLQLYYCLIPHILSLSVTKGRQCEGEEEKHAANVPTLLRSRSTVLREGLFMHRPLTTSSEL